MLDQIHSKGAITIYTLVFAFVFFILLGGILNLVTTFYKASLREVAWNQAFHIAEAGIERYRWYLSHIQEDLTHEKVNSQDYCCKSPPCDTCPFYDTQGQEIGSFSLTLQEKTVCDEILGVYVTSSGYEEHFPNTSRKIKVKFAATSIADYAYLLNDSVWAGEDRQIYGKYHSNKGIRMDGTHNSLVTSALDEWICTPSFGCSSYDCPDNCEPYGSYCKCGGVCGDGGPQDLWKYPVPPFDFAGITQDLSRIKELAQAKGKYYPPSNTIDPQGKGYHLIFRSDGTYDIKIVKSLKAYYAYDTELEWHWSYEKIQSETTYETGVTLPENCGLIYVEDNLWIEGTVKGKKTVASANLIDPYTDTTTYINWNLDYTTLDGSDSLALISEQDIFIPLHSPDDMTVRGVFVAQKGHFGRKHYNCWWYYPYCIRDHLLIYGTIVSNGRVGTKWVYSWGGVASGYLERDNYFDSKLAKDPPPLLPYVSETLEPIFWEEVE